MSNKQTLTASTHQDDARGAEEICSKRDGSEHVVLLILVTAAGARSTLAAVDAAQVEAKAWNARLKRLQVTRARHQYAKYTHGADSGRRRASASSCASEVMVSAVAPMAAWPWT